MISISSSSNSLSKAILKTLVYADIFDYPLNRQEIRQWLIGVSIQDQTKLNEVIEELVAQKIIGTKENYFFLRKREEIVKERKRRERWAKEKWKIAQKTAKKLQRLPTIKLIGVSGALTMNNARWEDDIDLLIISFAHTLWLTRLLILLFAPFLGIRRRKPREEKVRNKICFNLFLDENHLKVGPPSLFLAHEVCQLKPLVNKNNTYEKFLRENQWLKKYLPNAVSFPNNVASRQGNHHLFIVSLFNCFIVVLNKLAFILQYLYMKPKITNEKISLSQALFHPFPLTKKVENLYRKRLKVFLNIHTP